MKKRVKRIFSVLLCIMMFCSLMVPAFAENGEKSYPYVFVHGMMGWGENGSGFLDGPYWGFKEETNVPEHLRSLGYTVAVPTVGPMSSAWDRACEVYAQLTGTVVDYGAAHSEKCGHARYGRDYTGRPLIKGGWDGATPINLVSHSFGGPAISVFASIMEYGAAEEIAASPEDCSEFFKGGKPGVVHSANTLASPHNGTPLANLLYDIKAPVFLAAFIMNVFNTGTDYMFDQFGITKDPVTGERASFNPSGIMALYRSDDHCAYEMTIRGARELNEKFPPASGTYYFSYTGDITTEGKFGRKIGSDFSGGIFGLTGSVIKACAGKYIGGEKLGKEWAASDGFIPVVSGLYPFSQPHADYAEGTKPEKGVWYAMPVIEGGSHGYHVSGTPEKLFGFYDGMISVIESAE